MRTFDGYMHGVDLGGWLSQYDEGTREHFDTFITEDDIRTIASYGFDHVRVPVDYKVVETEDGTDIPEGYAYIDSCIRWCRENGLRMVLDLHRTFGYTFDPMVQGDKETFFSDRSMQDRFFSLWTRFAKRYGCYSDMVSFELLNEVVSLNVITAWNDIAAEAVSVIRKYAPDTWIIIGGVQNNHVLHVTDLYPPADDHIVYNFHCYDPLIFTHQRAYWIDTMPSDITVHYPDTLDHYRQLSEIFEEGQEGSLYYKGVHELGQSFFEAIFAPAIEAAEKNDAPLYCGEYGVIDQAPVEDAARWLKDIHAVLRKHHIGHALWNYKGKDFGFIDDHFAPVREKWDEIR